MKSSLMRPASALFPLAGLICAFIGNAESVKTLFAFYFAIQLLSLCSTDAFRNAAAREPGMRRVDKRFGGALCTLMLGIALTWLGTAKLILPEEDMMGWIAWFGAAALINIEQLFEERMYALSRRTDGNVLSIVSNLLLTAGLLVDASGGMEGMFSGFYTLCTAGLAVLIAGGTSYIVEPARGYSLVPRNIGFFPKACVQAMLYPAACICLVRFSGILSALAGFIFWRLSRTVCRRANDESRSLNLLLVFASAIMVAAGEWIPAAFGFMAVVSLLCAVIVFCAPGWRLYTGTLLLIAAIAVNLVLPDKYSYAQYAGIGLCAIAVILNMHKAFLKKV